MSAEVDWALDQLGSVVSAQPAAHPLRRVNRDRSVIYQTDQSVDLERPIDKRTSDLQTANYVGVSLAERATTPVGTEYDHEVEATLSVRIEGYSGGFGHIDARGGDAGVPFETLVDQIRTALLAERSFPDVGADTTDYHTLVQVRENDRSAEWADYHRRDIEVRLDGFESLP